MSPTPRLRLRLRPQRTLTALLFVCALAATACGSVTPHSPPALTVSTTSGRLHGRLDGPVREFLGVRYAKPPVGDLRWAPPQPAPRAGGLVQARTPGARCAQTGAMGTASVAEDCLFVNVTTPRGARPGDDLPVMVWWHGGGYTSGAGSDYDARRLSAQGHVIVVTMNVRLGIFGYLGLPGLKDGGDFGFADELLGTRWAKQNARAFGGDPSNITVFGESNGAMEACAALTSPAARGLIDKVAMSSGGDCQLNWPMGGLLPGTPAQTPYTSAEASDALGQAIARHVHCAGPVVLTCLRRLPARALQPLNIDFSDVLAYDTPLLPTNPATAIRAGRFLHVPVISSGNRNEESSFVAGSAMLRPQTFTPHTYPALLARAFGPSARRVAAAYPMRRFASAAGAFSSLITDDSWACATLAGDDALARYTSVYAAEFDDPASPNVNRVHAPGVPQDSAHATDLPYLFDLDGKGLLRSPGSRRLARQMIGYWSSFARTGRPAAPGAPGWPSLHSGQSEVRQLRPGADGSVNLAAEHRCTLWQTINPKDRT